MTEMLPTVYLARHGETAWTLSGQHTGLTDVPLTERGEQDARRLGERLRRPPFPRVVTRPHPAPPGSGSGFAPSPSLGCSRARSSARHGLAIWRDSGPRPRRTAICSNGTTA